MNCWKYFFEVHDPTSLNRQGADVGTQYRSAIFYHDANQKEKAEYYTKELNKSGAYTKPIVTEISAFFAKRSEMVVQGTVTRSGEVLLLAFDPGEVTMAG